MIVSGMALGGPLFKVGLMPPTRWLYVGRAPCRTSTRVFTRLLQAAEASVRRVLLHERAVDGADRPLEVLVQHPDDHVELGGPLVDHAHIDAHSLDRKSVV